MSWYLSFSWKYTREIKRCSRTNQKRNVGTKLRRRLNVMRDVHGCVRGEDVVKYRSSFFERNQENLPFSLSLTLILWMKESTSCGSDVRSRSMVGTSWTTLSLFLSVVWILRFLPFFVDTIHVRIWSCTSFVSIRTQGRFVNSKGGWCDGLRRFQGGRTILRGETRREIVLSFAFFLSMYGHLASLGIHGFHGE